MQVQSSAELMHKASICTASLEAVFMYVQVYLVNK